MKLLAVFAGICLLALFFACSPATEEDVQAPPEAETDVFDFGLENLSELAGGEKPSVLIFWTTRCVDCVRAIPAVKEFYSDLGASARLVAVNIGESRERVEAFARAIGISYPVGLDSDGSVARKFNIVGVPTYILLGPGGDVEYSGHSLDELRKNAGF